MLPPKLKAKYLARFDELIAEGTSLYHSIKYLGVGALGYEAYELDYDAFARWRVNRSSLLDQVLPLNSVHRKLIEREAEPLDNAKSSLQDHLNDLKALREDFEKGYLEDLTPQIEAEIASDYLGQAESLLAEGQPGKYDHVPAAVLAGAVLEKALRKLCDNQQHPLPTVDNNSKPLMLNRLIPDLKKAGAYNEAMAKQLLAWADIRNHAAHGRFDQFTREQVGLMVQGIGHFLAQHLP